MKQFVVSVYLVIIVLGGLTFKSQTQILANNAENNGFVSATNNAIRSSDFISFLNFGLNKESNQIIVQPLFPSENKYNFTELFVEKYAEQLNNTQINHYLFFTEFYIDRFEGPDIIHPFNSFW